MRSTSAYQHTNRDRGGIQISATTPLGFQPRRRAEDLLVPPIYIAVHAHPVGLISLDGLSDSVSRQFP